MKLAIIGGSGLVGQALIQQAISQNIEVQYVARHEGQITHPLVEYIQGDIFAPEQWAHQLKDITVLIHLVGAIDPRTDLYRMNVESTMNAIKVCQQCQINKIVYLSAEHGPKKYMATVHQGEAIVKESGLQYFIIRPGLMYDESKKTSLINSILLDSVEQIPFLKEFTYRVKPLPVKYVAEYIIYCLLNEPTRKYLTLTQLRVS